MLAAHNVIWLHLTLIPNAVFAMSCHWNPVVLTMSYMLSKHLSRSSFELCLQVVWLSFTQQRALAFCSDGSSGAWPNARRRSRPRGCAFLKLPALQRSATPLTRLPPSSRATTPLTYRYMRKVDTEPKLTVVPGVLALIQIFDELLESEHCLHLICAFAEMELFGVYGLELGCCCDFHDGDHVVKYFSCL